MYYNELIRYQGRTPLTEAMAERALRKLQAKGSRQKWERKPDAVWGSQDSIREKTVVDDLRLSESASNDTKPCPCWHERSGSLL